MIFQRLALKSTLETDSDAARRRLIPCLASAVVIPTRKNGGRRETTACERF